MHQLMVPYRYIVNNSFVYKQHTCSIMIDYVIRPVYSVRLFIRRFKSAKLQVSILYTAEVNIRLE